jgi:hypothetical protein
MYAIDDIYKHIKERIEKDHISIVEDKGKKDKTFKFKSKKKTTIKLVIRKKNQSSQVSSVYIGIGDNGDDKMSLRYFGLTFNDLREKLQKYELKKTDVRSKDHYQITCKPKKELSKMIGFIDELLNLYMSATQKKSNNPQTVFPDSKQENQISETNTDLTHDESDISDVFAEIKEKKHDYESLDETERDSIIKSRIGQGRFREEVMNLWGRCCSVTGMNNCSVLKASHIKPWRDSSNEERLDPNNGLLLIPNLDTLFDLGFISFDEEGKIMISTNLSKEDRDYLGVKDDFWLRNMSPETKEYMKYHRDNIFKK